MEPTFNEWEHLQSTVMTVYNKLVREEFRDIEGDDGISTPRSSLKVACLSKDSDSAPMLAIRMLFFYMTCRKAQDLHQPVYGIPVGSFDEVRKYRPQITLHFAEAFEDVDTTEGYKPIYGEISFRLMTETSQSITESELRAYANRIKTEFGAGNGYTWRKGRSLLTYNDPENGYGLQIACRNESDGRALAQKVLDVGNRAFNAEKANYKENLDPAGAYPTNPGVQSVLGSSRKKPRKRPVADCRFRYASAKVWGLSNPVILYDKTYRHRNALVRD